MPIAIDDSRIARIWSQSPLVPQQGKMHSILADRQEVFISGMGLRMPPNLAFEAWERAGRQLSAMVGLSSWWLGDWLVYGKRYYPDRYQRAIRAAGLKYQTLRNYAWVSRRFELSRRRAALSFQHHAEVASLPPDEQDQWLDRAEKGMWTIKQLRTHIRKITSGGVGSREQLTAIRRIELPSSRVEWWRSAAEQSGIEFDDWIVIALDRAAEQGI
jgi:hypothetical protein